MKKSVVFAIFCFCLFTVSYSQSVKQESVRELIKVMKMDSMIIKNIDDSVLFSVKLNYLTDAIDALITGLDLKRKILPAIPDNIESGNPIYSTINSTNFDKIKVCLV